MEHARSGTCTADTNSSLKAWAYGGTRGHALGHMKYICMTCVRGGRAYGLGGQDEAHVLANKI